MVSLYRARGLMSPFSKNHQSAMPITYASRFSSFHLHPMCIYLRFSRFGGPIQLASNALGCVKAIDENLFKQVMKRFTFTGTRKCGIKDGIRNDWYSVFDAITNLAKWNELPFTGVIDRPDLQEILLDNMKPGTVVNSKAITKYVQNDDGTVDIDLESRDGGVTETIKGFDVVVGADGIWSNVRTQMWGETSARPGSATYSGYTLFAAENIMPPDSTFFKDDGYFDAGYKVFIGPGKYFVTSDVGSGRIQWYAFLALPPGVLFWVSYISTRIFA